MQNSINEEIKKKKKTKTTKTRKLQNKFAN